MSRGKGPVGASEIAAGRLRITLCRRHGKMIADHMSDRGVSATAAVSHLLEEVISRRGETLRVALIEKLKGIRLAAAQLRLSTNKQNADALELLTTIDEAVVEATGIVSAMTGTTA